MIAIRMLVDAEGAPHGHTIYTYEAGEMYRAGDTQPPMSDWLMSAFVASGRAVEVDEIGNPVSVPAAKRARKANSAQTGAARAATTEDAPAPSSDATEATEASTPAAEDESASTDASAAAADAAE